MEEEGRCVRDGWQAVVLRCKKRMSGMRGFTVTTTFNLIYRSCHLFTLEQEHANLSVLTPVLEISGGWHRKNEMLRECMLRD